MMPTRRASQRGAACLALAAVLLASGCSRTRLFDRSARARVPLPPPPVVQLEPGITPEVPLSLAPAPDAGRGAAYAPPDRISVAPPGSAGFARDIRHPERPLRSRGALVPRRAPAGAVAPSGALLGPSVTSEGLPAEPPLPPSRGGSPRSPAETKDTPSPAPSAPGIAAYWVAEPELATGGKPTLVGLRWLKDHGFRTVVNLQSETEAEYDSMEPSQVRQLGLDYIELPVTPDTIDADTVERFDAIVDNGELRPLFIHDLDGSRVGALWYLHRVQVDGISPEAARLEANRVGLKDSDSRLWRAIEQYLGQAR